MALPNVRTNRQRGVTTVELALVLPVLLLILCGILELANIMRIQMTINSAVTNLARVVALDPTVRTQAQANDYLAGQGLLPMVRQTLGDGTSAEAPTLSLTPENPTCTSASCDPFVVRIAYTYTGITPLTKDFFDGLVLSASATKTAEPGSTSSTAANE